MLTRIATNYFVEDTNPHDSLQHDHIYDTLSVDYAAVGRLKVGGGVETHLRM